MSGGTGAAHDAVGRVLVADSLVYRYNPVLAPDGLDDDVPRPNLGQVSGS
jgi:hypothetical protein